MGGLISSDIFLLADIARRPLSAAVILALLVSLPLTLPIVMMGSMMVSDWRAERRKRFGWPSRVRRILFWAGALVVMFTVLAIASWVWQLIPQGPSEIVEEGLSNNPRLKDVYIDGFSRGGSLLEDNFVMMNASMRFSGRDDGEIVFDHPTPDLLTGARHIRLLQLGTWKAQESAMDVGPEGELAPLLPFEVATVDDVIDHFDEIADLLANLPARREAHTKEVLERANRRDVPPGK